ncbi:hypothetical protein GGH97_004641, partial [Coemansia sp. RSA 475]
MQEVDIPLTVHRVIADGGRRSSISSVTFSAAGSDILDEETAEPAELERTLGLWSGMAIVVGTIIGSGIFSTPSLILAAVGSVGMSMVVWVLGAVVSVCACVAYMELGTMLPRSGGEKEYLQAAFPRPRALLPFVFCLSSLAVGSPSGLAADSAVTGTYFMYAATGRSVEHSEWAQRAIGVAVALFCTLMHGFFVRAAIRLQSVLTVVKVLLLVLIVTVGFGVGIKRGTRGFGDAFAGTSTHPSAY